MGKSFWLDCDNNGPEDVVYKVIPLRLFKKEIIVDVAKLNDLKDFNFGFEIGKNNDPEYETGWLGHVNLNIPFTTLLVSLYFQNINLANRDDKC